MTDKTIVESKYDAQLLYEIYNSEDEMMNEAVECRLDGNCKYCKSLNDCEWGMHSLSL